MESSSKRTKTTTNCLPAGRYYVGDLCYVFDNRPYWLKMVDGMYEERPGMKEGFHEMPDGMQFYAFSTGGDGTFVDSKGREYPVDAALIGCVHEKYMSEDSRKRIQKEKDEPFGYMFDFNEPFECWIMGDSHHKYLRVGNQVKITLENEEEDENEEEEEEETE